MNITSGRQSWADLRSAAQDAVEWVWQDLDGLQRETTLPGQAPRTSNLWGWTADRGTVIRARVDGNETFVAVRDSTKLVWTGRASWASTGEVDGRIAQHEEKSGGQFGPAFQPFETATLRNDSGAPVTFVRPTG